MSESTSSTLEPGVYPGLSFEDYCNIDAVNSSSLKLIRKSPAHFRGAYLKKYSPPTDAQMLGTQIHSAVLEPKKFNEEFAIQPEYIKTRRGQAWEELVEEMGGAEFVIRTRDLETIESVKNAVHLNDPINQIIEEANKGEGEVELSIVWRDEGTGVLCKARIDLVHFAKGIILDLKTTKGADTEGFLRDIITYRYVNQAAFYAWGLSVIKGKKFRPLIVAAEKSYPFGVQSFSFESKVLQAAHEENMNYLRTVAKCQASGQWDCYPEEVRTLSQEDLDNAFN